MQKRYYAYVRVSTAKQGEKGSSLQEQRSAIESYAKRYGLVVSEWFEEKETAAKRGRPQFAKVISGLRNKQANGLIIHKIDRSARNLKDWADLGELIDAGSEVHFAHENLDLHSRGGRLSADIQAVVAADFIRNLRDEVRKGMRGRLKQGLYPLRAPIGYLDCGKAKPKIPDPERAPLIRQAFELYQSGTHNLEMLVDDLYARGLRNRIGGKVTLNGISTILNNPFYYGLIRIERTGETFAGVHEPLIGRALFEAVQNRLNGRRKIHGLRRAYLYQKMLRCYTCKGVLIAELQKRKYVYYRCHTKNCETKCVREESISTQIAAYFSGMTIQAPELRYIEQRIAKLSAKLVTQAGVEVKRIDLHLTNVHERLARLTDALLDQLIDRDEYETRKRILLDDKLSLEEKRNKVKAGFMPEAVNLNKFLELLKALSRKAILEKPDELLPIAKSVTSNLSVHRKRLVPTWDSKLAPLFPIASKGHGEPYRGTYRTLSTRSVNRLVQTLFRNNVHTSPCLLS